MTPPLSGHESERSDAIVQFKTAQVALRRRSDGPLALVVTDNTCNRWRGTS
jgi:hypothetical protein